MSRIKDRSNMDFYGNRLYSAMKAKGISSGAALARIIVNDIENKSSDSDKHLNNVTKTVQEHLNSETYEELKRPGGIQYLTAFRNHLGCSIDYLLGFDPLPTPEKSEIYRNTGLTNDSIDALEHMKKTKDLAPYAGFLNEIDTLNFILENANKEMKKRDIGYADSIFHYIGQYLHADTYKIVPVNRIRYKTRSTVAGKETYKLYGEKETNDSQAVKNTRIDGKLVYETIISYEDGADYVSYPTGTPLTDYNKIRAVDTSTNEQINKDFPELMKSYSKDKIMEKLFELRTKFNQK